MKDVVTILVWIEINWIRDLVLGYLPMSTYAICMDVSECLNRIKKRKSGIQKYEKMSINFHKKIRNGFLEIAKKNKKRCFILNANEEILKINKKILQIINKKFKKNF